MDELHNESWNLELERFRSPYVFRGMGNAHNSLRSSLMRLADGYRELASIENHLLRNFRKYAQSTSAAGDSLWNWMALAAHHGLPTRLVDWTYSPFVALHFATESVGQFDYDAVVWCVNHRETNRRLPAELRDAAKAEGSDVFTVELLNGVVNSVDKLNALSKEPFMLFLEPPSLDARIVNQFALFSLMSDPSVPVDEWLGKHDELARRIIIPAALKREVRDKLDQSGITERMLFPGLDGLSAWLTRYYTPKGSKPLQKDEELRNAP